MDATSTQIASNWETMLSAMVLVLIRLGGIIVLAPFFSSKSLPAQAKAVFCMVTAFLLTPLVSGLPRTHAVIKFETILSELAVGLIYGLVLAFLNEMMLFAGQLVGLQFSFSLVNLLDPSSEIQTPLMGNLFSLLGTLVLLAAGLDRVLLASFIRSFRAVPPGTFFFTLTASTTIVQMASGIFFAAVELSAPVLAATLLVEVTVGLMGKLSPQLPVMSLNVPAKTLTGFVVLIGSLAVWPRFIEARFDGLLDVAEKLIAHGVIPGAKG